MAIDASNRTVLAVRSVQHEGETLVSRAEAKRIVQGFGRFEEVVLDFDGVAEIGRAFADELFRVYAAAHPHIRITAVNTAPAVDQMIRRAVAASNAQGSPGVQS
jgi:hypothetical protein